MKILAIGNSFSEDATAYLQKIAASAGVDCKVVNLYIGGCSLETHADNIRHNRAAYRYELNGKITSMRVSIEDTLKEDEWDIVTVQQCSRHSGLYDTYVGHIDTVLDCIKTHRPKARIYFHETWAYEFDSTHSGFAHYNNDQEIMHRMIRETADRICQEHSLSVIPTGDVIQAVRQTPLFDVPNDGQTLCRDGFHLHRVYGRYLAALVWFITLLGGKAEDVTFVPTKSDWEVNGPNDTLFVCDVAKIDAIKKAVSKLLG